MKIAVQAYAGVLYNDVCYSIQTNISQAHPIEFETSDFLGLAKDLYAKVSKNNFFLPILHRDAASTMQCSHVDVILYGERQ